MAPQFLRDLKGVNFSCASPSSAAVADDARTTTTTADQHPNILVSSSGIGGRAIDRCSPHLRDPLRAKSLNSTLLSSQPPPRSPLNSKNVKPKKGAPAAVELAGSRRYLLSSTVSSSEDFFEPEPTTEPAHFVTVHEPASLQLPTLEEKTTVVEPSEAAAATQKAKIEEETDAKPSPPPPPPPSDSDDKTKKKDQQQVVVLRVSLHCKGCEGKVRKHISKMEGVSSFTTDLPNKKVTVVGDVTPLGVLNSISKVKNAQLWPLQPRPWSAAAASST